MAALKVLPPLYRPIRVPVTHGGIAVAALKVPRAARPAALFAVTHGGIAVAALKGNEVGFVHQHEAGSPTAASPWPR